MAGISPKSREASGSYPHNPTGTSPNSRQPSSLASSSSTPSPFHAPLPSRQTSSARFRDPSWMYHPTGQRFAEDEDPIRSWHLHSVQVNQARQRMRQSSPPPLSHSPPPRSRSPITTFEHHVTRRMRSLSLASRQAPLTIDFLIVGGSIAGLATALALTQAGHRVHVIEKAPSIDQLGVGIRVAPNCSKILVEWGLEEELEKLAHKCRRSAFRDLDSGEVLGVVEWKEDIIQEAGGQFYLMLYNDLRKLLYDRAVSNGAKVTFNATVASVSADDEDGPCATLADGTVHRADVIIGADGQKSTVRRMIAEEEPEAIDTHDSYYSIVIPGDRMREDPELAEFPDLQEWPMWMGDMRVALTFGARQGSQFVCQMYWPNSDTTYDGDDNEGWETTCSPDVIDFSKYDPRIQKMYNLAERCQRTKYVLRAPPDEWVHPSGRMLLIGEAAHPLLPFSTQGAGMAVEDAACLGSLMSRLYSWDQIPMLLEAFQDLRKDRCMDVGLTELNNATLVTLPPGPTRDGRDAAFRQAYAALQKAQQSGERWSDEELKQQWDEIGFVFAHHARESAEDWWVNWGALGEGGKGKIMHEPLKLNFEVEVTETVAADPISWTKTLAMG